MGYTPKPWKAVPKSVLNDGTQDEMGDGLGWDIEGPPEPQLRGQFAKAADAFLAAAAPELLEELISLTTYVQQNLIPNVREIMGGQAMLDAGWTKVSQAHAAIAKAMSKG